MGGNDFYQLISQPAQNSMRGLAIEGQYYPISPFQFQLMMACQISINAANRVSCRLKPRLSIIRMLPYILRDIMSRLVYDMRKERMGKNRRAVLDLQNTNRNTSTQKIVLKKKSLQLSTGKGSKGQIILLIMQQEPNARRAFIPKFEITQNTTIFKLPTPFCRKRLQRMPRQRCTHPQLSLMHLSQKIRKAVQVKKTVYRMNSPIKRLSMQSKNREETANRNFSRNQENNFRLINCKKLMVWRQIDSLSWLQQVRNSQLILSLAFVMLFLSMQTQKSAPKAKKDYLSDQITNQLTSMSLGIKYEKNGQLNCLQGSINLSNVIPWSVKYSCGLLPRQDSCQFCTMTIKGSALLSQTKGQLISYWHFEDEPNSTFIIVFQSTRTQSSIVVLFCICVPFNVLFLVLERACFQMTKSSRH